MSEDFPPLLEMPKLPRGRLWTYLLAPLICMAISTLVTFQIGNSRVFSTFTNWLPAVLGLLTLMVFIVCLIGFIMMLNRRFATTTVVLLSCGYVIGHGVISFTMFFGTCLFLM